eukprot:scaffold5680_cov122-Isochrysis_galbana.AAC.8
MRDPSRRLAVSMLSHPLCSSTPPACRQAASSALPRQSMHFSLTRSGSLERTRAKTRARGGAAAGSPPPASPPTGPCTFSRAGTQSGGRRGSLLRGRSSER